MKTRLVWCLGDFRLARVWHFAATCGLLLFVLGHLAIVEFQGWRKVWAMLTGYAPRPGTLSPGISPRLREVLTSPGRRPPCDPGSRDSG
jgi:hypothetical protein